MEKAIELLKKNNLLKIIDDELDINLEIPHVAYVEIKKENPKALLFTSPVDKKNNKKFKIPVLMNVFCNMEAVKLFIGDIDKIANDIESLIKLKPPVGLVEKISIFSKLFSMKNIFPKKITQKGLCQEIIKTSKDVNLSELPILKTWEKDGGPFITMGQVYTKSLDGKMVNLGMYRLQVYDNQTLGMHWQIHKDSNHFFHEYKKANKKMPVSVGIGGDPMYIWCGQAPLPIGIFELLLYGFVKNKNAKLVKSITNDIYVPFDNDFVIEGYVDPNEIKIEGPFGDHTGYYTLEEEYPCMHVEAITSKRNPTYLATVVGKPPLEDKYMGYATEKIFAPLLRTTTPDLIDYHMPENGVFHNLILAKIKTQYPGHAMQVMHAFWGVGQMSFVKHAIFVNEDAPDLEDNDAITKYILNNLDVNDLIITKGIVDALDHSSPKFAVGGKLGIDCTEEKNVNKIEILNDKILLKEMQKIDKNIKYLKQYFLDTKNPIVLIAVDKKTQQKELFDILNPLYKNIKILVIIDNAYQNDVENSYMSLWRVVNNIDAQRDIYIKKDIVCIDATRKNELDNFARRWPDDVDCSMHVIKDLKERKIIDIDDNFIKKFQL